MEYFSCYKLNNKSTLFQEKKKLTKPEGVSSCHCNLKFCGIQTLLLINFRKKKVIYFNFYTCIPEKVAAYHTGSAFTSIITYIGY